MTIIERQAAAIKVLILLDPIFQHELLCPAHKDPTACNCYLIRNARTRVEALDEAGLLCDPKNETLQCDPKEMDIMR